MRLTETGITGRRERERTAIQQAIKYRRRNTMQRDDSCCSDYAACGSSRVASRSLALSSCSLFRGNRNARRHEERQTGTTADVNEREKLLPIMDSPGGERSGSSGVENTSVVTKFRNERDSGSLQFAGHHPPPFSALHTPI